MHARAQCRVGRELTCAVVCLALACAASSASLACVATTVLPCPTRLLVEYAQQPLGVDVPAPRFFWTTSPTNCTGAEEWRAHSGECWPVGARGITQDAFQVQVAACPDVGCGTVWPKASLVWDTGVVTSPNNSHVVYAGAALQSDATYAWRVRWCATGAAPAVPLSAPCSAFAESEFGTGFIGTPATPWSNAAWLGGGGTSGPGGAGAPSGQAVTRLRTEFLLPRGQPVVRARCYVASPSYYQLRVNGVKVGALHR